MTEKEAGEKWCAVMNQDGGEQCLASHCMMWRWHQNKVQFFQCKAVFDAKTTECYVCKTQLDPYSSGYCGLAGVPEEIK